MARDVVERWREGAIAAKKAGAESVAVTLEEVDDLLAVVEAAKELNQAFEELDEDELLATPNYLLLRWGGLNTALARLYAGSSGESD